MMDPAIYNTQLYRMLWWSKHPYLAKVLNQIGANSVLNKLSEKYFLLNHLNQITLNITL